MTDKNGAGPTWKALYELVDARTQSIDNKMQRLADRFDNLEAGRLSNLETQLANLKGKIAVWGVIGGSVMVIISALLSKAIK